MDDLEDHADAALGRQRGAVIVIVHGLAQHRKRLLGRLAQRGIRAHAHDLGDEPARVGPVGRLRRPQAFESEFPGFKPSHHARNV
ncbi:hypothetical protein ABIF93_006202 [Bradyrhizobium japonicum]